MCTDQNATAPGVVQLPADRPGPHGAVALTILPAVAEGDQRRRWWYANRADETSWQPVPHHIEQAHHEVVRQALWAMLGDPKSTMALADNRQVAFHVTVPGLGLVHGLLGVPNITTIAEADLKGAA